jgi:toxin ParE1/3/4
MGYKVILSPEAIQQLEQSVRLIAKDNPDAARRFGFKLLDRTELLSNFPELGREYRKRPGVRRLLCKPYFIYYRVKRETKVVEVMDFWHSARREPEI